MNLKYSNFNKTDSVLVTLQRFRQTIVAVEKR